MTDSITSNFHAGETSLQERIGVAGHMAKMSQLVIYDAMPDQHRDFYHQLPFAIVAIADKQGFPMPTLVSGQPGFMSTPDDKTLLIKDKPLLAQELNIDLQQSSKIGFLGIELHTRRRNRMNGIFRIDHSNQFVIEVDQSFGNCPQYIQLRDVKLNAEPKTSNPTDSIVSSATITTDTKSIIESSDTFYIGSRTDTFDNDSRSGIDASHRGGKPGFVKVNNNGNLQFPDFSGNRFFNTLGNIQLDNRVGLLFMDFESADLVYVAGRALVHWEQAQIEQVDGAERIIEVQPEKVVLARKKLPIKSEFIDYSPVLARTGVWQY